MPTPSSPDDRRPARLLKGAILVLAVLCLAVAALRAALPRLAREFVVPMAASKLGIAHLDAEIRRADLSGLDLGEISLGPDAGIRVEAVQADWSLTGLMRGRVDRVRVMGLHVLAREENGTWTVRGLPRMEESEEAGHAAIPQIGEFSVDGVVELDGDTLDLRAPFSLGGNLDEAGLLVMDALTHPAGQELRLLVRADLGRRDVRLTCALPPASVAALASLVPGLRNLPVSGTMQALADAALPPDGKPSMQASLELASVQALLGGSPVAQDGNATVRLDWGTGLNLAVDPVRLDAPLPLVLTLSGIKADLQQGALDCGWELNLAALPGLDLPAPLLLAGQTSVRRTETGWDLRTRGGVNTVQAGLPQLPGLTLALNDSSLSLHVSTTPSAARIDASFGLGRLRATRGQAKATLAGLDLTCNATTGSRGTNGTLSISGARLDAMQPGLTLNTTRLDGNCLFALGERTDLQGAVRADLRARSGDAAATVSLRLPLAWPAPASSNGSLAVDASWKKKRLAKISSRIAQNLHGFTLDGSLTATPVAIRASLKGVLDAVRPEASWVEVKTDQRLSLPGDLPSFVPALATLAGEARLEASARLDLSRGVPSIPASATLTDFTLTHEKAKAELTGGSLAIAFADLLSGRSEPAQFLTFERLQLGTVILDKGDVRFQVEAPHSILVEGCGFRWAGGRIGTQAFRVNPGVEDYTVEMYCDRVELAQALGQLGMTQARGGGTANGRIPVRWAGGALTFDNGFLYSTPGEKAVLRIEGTEILTAGVPPGTPQFGQLDLASEALKDFAYEWAKVTMNTEGRELVVSLQLDGKPEKALPFVYDRDFGGFARVSASSPGSVFQGIRLDVNFRLPLDQLLQYRQLLELMNNGG
jgi:hypothetical protein